MRTLPLISVPADATDHLHDECYNSLEDKDKPIVNKMEIQIST